MPRRYCKPFSKAALNRGAKIEHREHPGFSKRQAREIARDHLCAKGERAYSQGSLGEFWLNDPRMPDRDTAIKRRFSRKFPAPPWRAKLLAEKTIPARPGKQGVKMRVESNRTGTRFWFTASYAPDYQFMADHESTTSKRIAQGWIDALTKR